MDRFDTGSAAACGMGGSGGVDTLRGLCCEGRDGEREREGELTVFWRYDGNASGGLTVLPEDGGRGIRRDKTYEW